MKSGKAIDYTQQLEMVTAIMRLEEIVTRKRTHVFRVAAAQALDAAG